VWVFTSIQSTTHLVIHNMSFVYYHYHHNHHYLANMQLGHLLTCSGLTLSEVCSMLSPGFFCRLVCSFFFSILDSLSRCLLFTYCNQFCCIPYFVHNWGLYLVLLQKRGLFYDLSKCVLLVESKFLSTGKVV
jgi:hypothetical protein